MLIGTLKVKNQQKEQCNTSHNHQISPSIDIHQPRRNAKTPTITPFISYMDHPSRFIGPNHSDALVPMTQMLCLMQQIRNHAYPFDLCVLDTFLPLTFDQ